ncbi:MAG TPA: histidine phosphatase family protein [Rhodospirillales bacterium]|nr:histidine phosphatase family protein [Rhodospirillales bacterium]
MMIPLVVLRHGPTSWNAAKKIQGRSDIALGRVGRDLVGRWRLGAEFTEFECVTSPLIRAVETARIMGLAPSGTIDDLIEMDWGDWEGRTLADLRTDLGPEMTANEKRGLDFRAPGGESPRDIQRRLQGWLKTLTKPTIAVTHKGVIRALYALAVDWHMTADPPQKLRDGMAHGFFIDGHGHATLDRLNMALEKINS